MPIELNAEGLQIQGTAEIVSELNTAYQGIYGIEVNVTTNSVFGQEIGVQALREASVQQVLLALYSSFDPANATGVPLSDRAALTGTIQKPATFSKSASFQLNGTPGTIVNNDNQFQLIQKQEDWVIVDGPYTIGAGGSVAATAQAAETGPKTFLTSPTTAYSILTPVAGWASVQSTADIDPEDTGSNVESAAELRARRIDELLIQGNDVDAIRAAVGALVGVTSVAVFDNTSCVATFDGIPPGAFEVVVDGGVDAEIAAAIFAHKPPGAEAFGALGPFNQTTVEGQVIPIGFTRPTDVDIDVEIDADSTGAEFPLPVNAVALITSAALDAFNADAQIGRDIFPPKYITTVFVAVRTNEGHDTIVSAEVRMRVGADPFATTPIVITLRQRPDFDSANITTVVT